MTSRSSLLSALCVSAALLAAPQSADAFGPTVFAATKGRPTVKLDRLEFPEVHGAAQYKKHLKRVLRREVRKADWGVGRGHKIEYRFRVAELKTVRRGDVLRVSCAAVGELPRGKTAKSQLSFGGSPKKQRELVKRVLEIVARGVITRLAEMERVRRGDLRRSRVRTPAAG